MYAKIIIDSYIAALSTGGGVEITESEYNAIMQKIQTKPTDPDGCTYRLRADTLEWELVELPPVEPEPLTNEEALTRYANEITGASDQTLVEAAETLITKLSKEE